MPSEIPGGQLGMCVVGREGIQQRELGGPCPDAACCELSGTSVPKKECLWTQRHLDIDSLGKVLWSPRRTHFQVKSANTHTEEASQVMKGGEHVEPAMGRKTDWGAFFCRGDGRGQPLGLETSR